MMFWLTILQSDDTGQININILVNNIKIFMFTLTFALYMP